MTIKSQIHKYLSDRTGLVVHLDDIVKDLNIKESTARSTISHLGKEGFQIDSPFRGGYRYMGTTNPAPKVNSSAALFEKVGESKTGKIVLQDEDGNLYVAEAF